MADAWTLDQAKTPAGPASTGGGFSLDQARGTGGASQPAAPARPSIWQRIGEQVGIGDSPVAEDSRRQLKMGVGHVVDSAGAALGFFANPVNTLVNAALPGDPLSTHIGEGWSEAAGLPQPQTRRERLIKDVAVGAGAGMFTAGGAEAGLLATRAPGVARSFMQFLGEGPVVNTIAGGTGNLSAGVTREAGGGELAQTAAGLVGGLAGGAGAHIAGRPRAPVTTSGGALEFGSLDGGVAPVPEYDPATSLRAAGADPAQFSSPEVAATMAARAEAARSRVPQNGLGGEEAARQQSIRDAIGIGATDPAWAPVPPVRTIPDEVPIIAAPEGNIRADDAGGIAGLSRTRAANDGVMQQAQGLVDQDPLLGHILDSNVSPQAKMATIWQRIEALRNNGGDVPQFDPVDVTGADAGLSPWQQPTPERAAAASRVGNLGDRMNAITERTESGGRDVDARGNVVTSSAGAKGRMQVMDATNRDPGYGVRPAANDSLEERARVGRDYRAALLDHYGNDPSKAWAAYNAGPGALDGAVKKYGADWLEHMPAETRAYVRKNMAALGDAGRAPEPYRAPDPNDPDIDFGNRSPAERTDAQASPTQAEMGRGAVFQNGDGIFTDQPGRGTTPYEAPMATGGSERPVRVTGADPEGRPGHWEAEAQRMQDDLAAKMRASQEETAKSAGGRMEGERTAGTTDASADYRGKYDQRPVAAGDGWTVNEGGYVAGKGGNPVAFRSAREAAQWAAKNKMGGDFDLAVWEANSKRVVLRRKEGSEYGRTPETGPQPAQGAAFDAAAPAAGRSADRSQRLIDRPAPARQEAVGGADVAQPVERLASIENVAGSTPVARSTKLPEDALTFIAKNGGLRNDEGHSLRAGGRELAQYAPGGGHVFRKNGMSIDRAGEMLHEAGFFTERPSTADVLEMLDRSAHDRQYRPRDVGEAADLMARRNAPAEQEAAFARADETADEYGVTLTDDERHGIAAYAADGRTQAQAFEDYFADQLEAKTREAGHEPTAEDDIPFDAPDRNGTASARRPEGDGRAEGSDPAPNGRAPAGGGLPDETGVTPGREERQTHEQLEFQRQAKAEAERIAKEAGLPDGFIDDVYLVGSQASGTAHLNSDHDFVVRFKGDPNSPDVLRAWDALSDHFDKVGAIKTASGTGKAEVFVTDELYTDKPAIGTKKPTREERLAKLDRLVPPGSEGKEFRVVRPDGVTRVGDLSAARREMLASASRRGKFDELYDPIMAWDGKDATIGDMKVARGHFEELDAKDFGTSSGDGAAPVVREELRDILTAQPKEGVARMIEAGLMVRDGDMPRARLTDEGRKLLWPKLQREIDSESGFITADMLLAPLRAAGNLVDWKGLRGDADAILRTVKEAVGDPKRALASTGGRLTRFASSALYSADGSARSLAAHFDSPTLTAFADLFHAEAGKPSATARTYEEAIDRGTRTRIQQVYDALEPHMADKPALSRIRDLLATPRATIGATAAERAAAVKVRDVLKETLEYRRAAGEDLGEVSDGYFPRVLEPQLVAKDPVKFTRAAEGLYRGIGLSAKDAKDAADAWTMRVMDSYAGIDGGLDHVKAGSTPNSSKGREFGKAADSALKEFYQADPFLTLSNYIQGSVKRAEQNRRFGAKGAVGSPERAAWEKAHPDQTQWGVMVEKIRDEVRASGKEAVGVMDRVAELKASNLGQIAPTNRYVKNTVSMLHTWNQLSKMDRVTVSSLGDLTMGFVRGGPKLGFQHLAESVHQFGRQVAKMKPDEATRYAEAIGTANDAFGSAVMLARTDAQYTGAGSHQLIDKFYRGVGLQQLTDAGRIAATKTGQRFLSVLSDDLQSGDARTRTRAAGYLRELGVKDPDAFGQNLRAAKPTPDDILADRGFPADYATAVMRYVNQSIIMPSRAQKPTWANHPLGNLFFALQGYSYGFKKNVLDRVGRETAGAIKERDPRKLSAAAGLTALVGLQYLNDTYLRPALFGSNYDFASETPQQAAIRTFDRAGLLGPLSGVWNAFHPTKYNRGPAAALAGPILGDLSDQTYKTVKWLGADNPNTNTDERAAAGALYDTIVEPAVDGLAAARLRGVARSAAILGTGQRAKNGLLPADREAFVSGIAGEKQ